MNFSIKHVIYGPMNNNLTCLVWTFKHSVLKALGLCGKNGNKLPVKNRHQGWTKITLPLLIYFAKLMWRTNYSKPLPEHQHYHLFSARWLLYISFSFWWGHNQNSHIMYNYRRYKQRFSIWKCSNTMPSMAGQSIGTISREQVGFFLKKSSFYREAARLRFETSIL